jgi:hypothetical protein
MINENDGIALYATIHPIPPLRERLYWRWVLFWRWQILYRFCWWKRPYETVEIEIRKDL